MIAIDHKDQLVTVAVLGKFMLDDIEELERLAEFKVKFEGPVNLLVDLREMADYSLDVAWEEIKFARSHGNDFAKVAVLTSSQWVTWSAWLTRAVGNVELKVFEEQAEAEAWLAEQP